jgi:tetratricopeptide (TPR) repeat protein
MLAWPAVALLPVSNLIPIWSLMAERYLYLPAVGVFVAASVLLCGWGREVPGAPAAAVDGRDLLRRPGWRWARAAVAAVVLLACALATAARVPVWGDELRFWDDVAAKSPTRIKAHNNRGDVLLRRGRVDEAGIAFLRALELNPRGPMAHFNLGRVAEARGDFALAEDRYRQALALNPDLLDAWKGVGDLRLRAGDATQAERAYREFLSRHEDARVRFNLAVALFNRDALQEAAAEARQVAQQEPRLPEPLLLQGHVARRLGHDREAEEHYRKVLTLGPSVEAHYNLATMSEKYGRRDEAIVHLEAAAGQVPGERRLWEALARLYAEAGRPDEARRATGRARALAAQGAR